MKHADRIIDLLAAFPGKEFRMSDIVRYIDPNAGRQKRQAIRNQALVALRCLENSNTIRVNKPAQKGSYSVYIWRK